MIKWLSSACWKVQLVPFDLSWVCDNIRRFDSYRSYLLCLIRLFSGNLVPCRRCIMDLTESRACQLHTDVHSGVQRSQSAAGADREPREPLLTRTNPSALIRAGSHKGLYWTLFLQQLPSVSKPTKQGLWRPVKKFFLFHGYLSSIGEKIAISSNEKQEFRWLVFVVSVLFKCVWLSFSYPLHE